MKAIVVGATGAVGRDLVELLCHDPRYTEVRTFTRRELGIENPKIHPYVVDFERTEGWHDLVQGDVIFSALGTSKKQAGSKEAQYHIDHDYQMMFAEFAKKNGARDQEQSGFDQRLGEDDVRRVHEHHRFAEGLAGTDDVDDLLVAACRSEREFDLAVENEVEPARRIALVEEDFAACGRQLARAARQAGELVVAQAVEQRYLGEQGGDVEVGASLHGGRWAAELSVMPDRRTHRPAQQAGSQRVGFRFA